MNRIVNTCQLLSKVFVIGILCITLLSQTTVCWAQSNDALDQAWNRVKALSNSSEVQIELKDGKKVKGKIDKANDDEIVMLKNKKHPQVARKDIKVLYFVKGKQRRGLGAALGAGAGFAAGAALGMAASKDADITYALTIPILGGLGAGIGAGVGFFLGGKKDLELLYKN